MDKQLKRRPTNKTKDKILKAAIKCFKKQGIDQTKLVDIAGMAGINHSLVLYHYKTYDDICYAVVQLLVQDYIDAFQVLGTSNETNAEKNLENYVKGHFQLAQKTPSRFSVWLYFYYKATQEDKYRTLLDMIRSQSVGQIQGMLARYAEAKGLSKEIDFNANARFVSSYLVGSLIVALTEKKFDLSQYGDNTYDFIEKYLECLS